MKTMAKLRPWFLGNILAIAQIGQVPQKSWFSKKCSPQWDKNLGPKFFWVRVIDGLKIRVQEFPLQKILAAQWKGKRHMGIKEKM